MRSHSRRCSNSDHKQPFMTTPWHAFAYHIQPNSDALAEETYPMLNERAVRATAGLMLLVAAIAFSFSYFAQYYIPIRIVTVLVFLDFALRLTTGMTPLSPFGVLGTWLVRKQKPEWVSAAPKRFAWSLGLLMSGTVAYLTNNGLNGTLSSTLCMICLVLMWMETAFGICLGCKIHSMLGRMGVVHRPHEVAHCAGDACSAVREEG